MTITRRSVLKAGATLAVLAATPVKLHARPQQGTFPIPAEALRDPLYYISRQQFEQQVGTKFKFSSEKGSGSLKLMSVKNLAGLQEWVGHECFSLSFRGSLKKEFIQDTYDIRHPALGSFRMLLVPVGMVDKTRHFEALINRMV